MCTLSSRARGALPHDRTPNQPAPASLPCGARLRTSDVRVVASGVGSPKRTEAESESERERRRHIIGVGLVVVWPRVIAVIGGIAGIVGTVAVAIMAVAVGIVVVAAACADIGRLGA